MREREKQDQTNQLQIREALPDDITRIVEIYNSNPAFLRQHLGKEQVDASFIEKEQADMQSLGFRSCVIEEEGEIIGVLDYKEEECVYLSLLMLDSKKQGGGSGSRCYMLLESLMKTQGRNRIRIDVVCNEPENALPFRQKQKFTEIGKTELEWGEKHLKAVVMQKKFD